MHRVGTVTVNVRWVPRRRWDHPGGVAVGHLETRGYPRGWDAVGVMRRGVKGHRNAVGSDDHGRHPRRHRRRVRRRGRVLVASVRREAGAAPVLEPDVIAAAAPPAPAAAAPSASAPPAAPVAVRTRGIEQPVARGIRRRLGRRRRVVSPVGRGKVRGPRAETRLLRSFLAVCKRLRLSRLPRRLRGNLGSLRRRRRGRDGCSLRRFRRRELCVRSRHDILAFAPLLLLGASLCLHSRGLRLLGFLRGALNRHLFGSRSLARVPLGGDHGGSPRRLQFVHLADHSLVLGGFLGLEDAAALLKLEFLRRISLRLGRRSSLGDSLELSLEPGVGGILLSSSLGLDLSSLGGFLLAA